MIQSQLIDMQLAKLPHDDMDVINCLSYLDGSNTKKSSRTGTFSLKFDAQKVSLCFFVYKGEVMTSLEKTYFIQPSRLLTFFFYCRRKMLPEQTNMMVRKHGLYHVFFRLLRHVITNLSLSTILTDLHQESLIIAENIFLVYGQVFSPYSWEFFSRTCALLYLFLAWVFF